MHEGESMEKNAIEEKSFAFAKEIISAYQVLSQEKKEFILSKQLLRAGTSIGANVAEAQYAQSKADFISKMSIAQKEAGETEYWLRLLRETDYLEEEIFLNLHEKVKEILRLLTSICKTASK